MIQSSAYSEIFMTLAEKAASRLKVPQQMEKSYNKVISNL